MKKWFSALKEHHALVIERNNKVYEKKYEKEEDKPFASGICFSKLFWLFLIGSFFGTIIETFWTVFIDGHFEIRVGMVIGPFIPVYGGGAVAFTLCLYKFHRANGVIIFIVAAVIGGAFEYLCSYFQEAFLGQISWDYSDTPFNLNGRTNLGFAVIWGVLGYIWIRYIYPVVSRVIEKIPKRSGRVVTIVVFVIMLIGGVLTCVAIDRKGKRDENIPPKTIIGQFCDTVFPDEYMEVFFPHLGTKETFAEERAQKDK